MTRSNTKLKSDATSDPYEDLKSYIAQQLSDVTSKLLGKINELQEEVQTMKEENRNLRSLLQAENKLPLNFFDDNLDVGTCRIR